MSSVPASGADMSMSYQARISAPPLMVTGRTSAWEHKTQASGNVQLVNNGHKVVTVCTQTVQPDDGAGDLGAWGQFGFGENPVCRFGNGVRAHVKC